MFRNKIREVSLFLSSIPDWIKIMSICYNDYMPDQEPLKDIVELAKQRGREVRLEMKRNQEAPVQWLNPEAHEDAMAASKNLFIEGISLLGQNPRCQIETPEAQLWTLRGKEFAKGVSNIPSDTDFLIYLPITRQTDEVDGETIEYRNIMRYAISPKGVILVERNEASLPGKNGLPVGESRPPRGMGIEIKEIGRDEINRLTETLRNRVNHYPNRG